MLSWFTRSQDRRQLPVQPTQWTVNEDDGVLMSRNDRRSGVTYASRDRNGNREFFCSLPEGSEHATRAQQIANSMFSGQRGSPRALKGGVEPDRRLIGGAESISPRRASPSGVRVRHVDARGNESVRFSGQDLAGRRERQTNLTPRREESRGFRHHGPTHTTFGLRSKSREMFVSAPNGSREAELHDRVATMGAEERSFITDRGVGTGDRIMDVE